MKNSWNRLETLYTTAMASGYKSMFLSRVKNYFDFVEQNAELKKVLENRKLGSFSDFKDSEYSWSMVEFQFKQLHQKLMEKQ